MHSLKIFFISLTFFTLLHSAEDLNVTKETGFFDMDKSLFISEDDGKFDVSA